MRIAQVAPLFESVPPKLYGGTERVVSYLTEELVRQGHEVTLYASGDSETSARLVPGCPKALWRDPGCRETLAHHVRQLEQVVREAHRFDVIHFHLDYVHLPVVSRLPCPSITTVHGRMHPPDHRPLFDAYPEAGLVSISDDQRRPIPEANWLATVYHGLPRELHTFRETPGTYLAFLGRLSPEKGVDRAVEIARRAGLPLKVAAKIYPEEVHYFEEVIEPLFRMSPWVEFVGEVGGAAKDAFLGYAKALLFPISWAEPFGLVMIEAMACGTPIVAFRCGSVPEVTVDGVTGFVVDDVPGAVKAVGRVTTLHRRECRHVFIDRFDSARMARDYLAIYRRLADSGTSRSVACDDWVTSRRQPILTPAGCLGQLARPAGRGYDLGAWMNDVSGQLEGDPHHVLAASGITDDRTRVLKQGDTFAVFDHFGNIKTGGLGEEGVYHESTRYLSRLTLELDDRPPFFLGSTVRDENDQLSVALTNPDKVKDGQVEVPLGTLHLAVRTFLWQGVCHWQLRAKNHGSTTVLATIGLRFGADFADIYEIRGMKRKVRGRDVPPEVSAERVVLEYIGLDGGQRRTLLRFTPTPACLTSSEARFELALRPREEVSVELAVVCLRGETATEPPDFEDTRSTAEVALERWKTGSCRVRASDGRFDAWLRRAESDLHILATDLPTGPYPYAGVPWFNTPFGRDGIITALECLWLRPDLARGVLSYLATTQATEVIPEQDAEPGKILHEIRSGEMAVLKEMPFGRYYGSVDATPLFVLLAGAYYERTGDQAFAETVWPNVEAGLGWIDRYGDRDGDGFVEYERRSVDGLIHQGWKDSDDAVFHADGPPATGPIALCEVQGYVYAALRAGAVMATALKMFDRAVELDRQAIKLCERFEAAFWLDDLGTYALALDGAKRPCRVRASNAGQCLFTGIAAPDRAARLARGLLAPDLFSGWGVRTLATGEARFNPMAYHNGTVWPHDNALIAYGFSRYGLQGPAVDILTGIFEAGTYFDLNRMPELFCGFARESGEGPVSYPVACAPQAWAAGSAFLLLQACLGLGVSAVEPQIVFTRPRLPAFLSEVRITNLSVAGATVDLLLIRHADDVGVTVLRREGYVDVVVAK